MCRWNRFVLSSTSKQDQDKRRVRVMKNFLMVQMKFSAVEQFASSSLEVFKQKLMGMWTAHIGRGKNSIIL